MGLYSTSCSFTRFRVIDSIPSQLWEQIPDRLVKNSFRDIDEIPEIMSVGWVNFDNMLDVSWKISPPQKGSFISFSMRLETRKIPLAVIKKHTAIALQKEKEEIIGQNRNFISRERKKELKENVIMKLRKRFLPVPAIFDVIWLTEKNEIWFFSIQSGIIDLFMEEFLKTFALHLERETPYNLACSQLEDERLALLDQLESTNFSH